jgi:hypothetical protein
MKTIVSIEDKEAARADLERRREKAIAHLRFHDRHYYGQRFKARDVKRELKSAGIEPKGIAIKRTAAVACTYFMSDEWDGGRRTPSRICFDGREWHKFQKWARNNADSIDRYLDTYASVARRMRHYGLNANADAVREVLAGMDIDLSQNPKLPVAAKVEAA